MLSLTLISPNLSEMSKYVDTFDSVEKFKQLPNDQSTTNLNRSRTSPSI